MAANTLVDAGFLVALLSARGANHRWAAAQAPGSPPPWMTCEVVPSETSHLLGVRRARSLVSLLRRGALVCHHRFADDVDAALNLLTKYADVPTSFADACLARVTETLNDPLLPATDADFRIYGRHGRRIIPCVLPR